MTEYTTLGNLITPAKVIRCGKGSYPVLSMTMHDGIVLQSDRFKKSLASIDQSDYKVVKYGQLVVGFPIDEGVLYIQKAAPEGIMSPAYNVWDVDTTKIDADYLELCLHSPQSMQYYSDKLRGTTARRRSIPTADLLALPIRLPSFEEQRAAVAIHAKMNTVIADRQQQLAYLDQLVKSRFIELFGDPITNDKDFPCKEGRSLFAFSSGKFLEEKKRMQEGIPVYGGNGIAWHTDSALIETPTLVIGRVGAYCGNVRMITEVAWITDNAIYIKEFKTDEFILRFLHELMRYMNFSQFADFSGQPKITQKPLESLRYIVPPIELQEQFSTFVEQTDKSKLYSEMEVAA